VSSSEEEFVAATALSLSVVDMVEVPLRSLFGRLRLIRSSMDVSGLSDMLLLPGNQRGLVRENFFSSTSNFDSCIIYLYPDSISHLKLQQGLKYDEADLQH
jgi:hypothetical protein